MPLPRRFRAAKDEAEAPQGGRGGSLTRTRGWAGGGAPGRLRPCGRDRRVVQQDDSRCAVRGAAIQRKRQVRELRGAQLAVHRALRGRAQQGSARPLEVAPRLPGSVRATLPAPRWTAARRARSAPAPPVQGFLRVRRRGGEGGWTSVARCAAALWRARGPERALSAVGGRSVDFDSVEVVACATPPASGVGPKNPSSGRKASAKAAKFW